MSKFVEFEYYETGKKFFLNAENVNNFQEWNNDGTWIAMMPHFDHMNDAKEPAMIPFVVYVKGTPSEVLEKLNG